MRKLFTFISLLAFLGMNSCKNEVKANESISDSTAVMIDTLQSKKMIDPDPTDSISADQYGINSSNPKTTELVRLTLNNRYKEDLKKNFINDFSKKFIFFEYDLKEDDKNEILVGLRGPYFCGSGGCTHLLLDYQGNVITTFSVSGNPIIIDTKKPMDGKIYSFGVEEKIEL
ncbi:hypothetical protein [Flavobacterium praedii]|uniref:hypothetical protein n=1 Tax=Flavobacterium praedii TaxID=3002900 RepID=UPI002481EC14|nr:hypothetical protein [Flavobacterium praedii]